MVLPPKDKIRWSDRYQREAETRGCMQKYGLDNSMNSRRLVFYVPNNKSCFIGVSYTDNSYGPQGLTAYYLFNPNQFSFVHERPSVAGWSDYFVSSGLVGE